MKKSKIYIQMLFSYLGILLIPILISTLLYIGIGNVIKGQARKLNDSLLDMVQNELDQKAEEIIKISNRLAMNMKVQKASRIHDQFQTEDQIFLYEIFKDLNNLNVSEAFIHDVFIYFKNTGTVCSMNGNMSKELYYHLYYENGYLSQEEFFQYIGKVHYADSIVIGRPSGEDILLFTMSALNLDITESTATVCIAVKSSDIQKIMDTILWDDQMGIFLVDENNAVIGTRSGKPGFLDYGGLLPGDSRDYGTSGHKDMVSVRQSVPMRWKYVTVIPEAVLDKDIRSIRVWSAAGLFACLIIGFFISYYLTGKNYNPIRSLMELFNKYRGDEIGTDENEYQWLSGQMDRFFKEQVDTKRILHNNKKNLKQYYLSQLIQYSYEGSGETLRQYGIHLNQPYYLVGLFLIKNTHGHDSEENNYIKENALRKFVLRNVVEEVLINYFDIELAEMGEQVAAVIGSSTRTEADVLKMKEQIENVQQMLEVQFGFGINLLLGAFGEGMEGIHASFLQAQELEGYLNLLDTDMVSFDEVRDIQPQYNYSVEAEQRIINAIKVGDAKKAKDNIAAVFQNNLEGKVSGSVYKCLIYDMIGTLLKGANAGGYPKAATDFDFDSGFDVKISKAELERHFCEVTDQICGNILENQGALAGDRSFSQKIEAYIREHYADPDLNISITSQHFKITPTYLSSVYKKQTGGSLLDYINTVRLDYAETFLQEGYSVVDAAAMSGFRDSGTFIRVFKKKRGITPGQLKKIYGKV